MRPVSLAAQASFALTFKARSSTAYKTMLAASRAHTDRRQATAVTFWNFLRDVSNAKMWISKFRFEIECIIKM
jgi:hypothetical protein